MGRPLEKGMATHSSILAWRIPWTVYSLWGCKESNTIEGLSLHFHCSSLLEGFFHWAGPIGYSAISVHCLSSRGKLTESFTTIGSHYKVSELFPNISVILVTCFGTGVYLWGFPLKCGIPKENFKTSDLFTRITDYPVL